MPQTPTDILESTYLEAQQTPIDDLLSALPDDCVRDLKTIIENAEKQKAVLGVTLTSITYKIHQPSQDIRNHQEGMANGYSGRTFDTKYVTPFMKMKFSHFAMAESAWLTRSLEQPHPYNLRYPGKIQNTNLKQAFLNTLDRVEADPKLARPMLTALFGLMLRISTQHDESWTAVEIISGVTIAEIIDALSRHIHYNYGKSAAGTARIPVVAIYSVYSLLISDVKRYFGKILAPLETHTSPDSRAGRLGDIDVQNADGSCFEALEVKHGKPITADMIDTAYRKIKDTSAERYYVLTTSNPNFDDYDLVAQKIEKYRRAHPCQIIVNGVIPSLKYYLRLISEPQRFIDEYTRWLQAEYQRGSGIKAKHLQAWHEILQQTRRT